MSYIDSQIKLGALKDKVDEIIKQVNELKDSITGFEQRINNLRQFCQDVIKSDAMSETRYGHGDKAKNVLEADDQLAKG